MKNQVILKYAKILFSENIRLLLLWIEVVTCIDAQHKKQTHI